MITHRLVRASWISHEILKDGTIETILHVQPTTPLATNSKPEVDLTHAIVDYMKKVGSIDRTIIER